jgi:predicted metal-dependent phosphoesterase TrpH
LLTLDNPGKPHIGNLMVKYGYAETKEDAMNRYINLARIRSEYIRPEEAIQGILDSGGIPVLAHPSYGSGDQLILGEEMDRRLRRLMEFGLRGLEAYYSGFTGRIRRELLSFAEKYDLYVTAGSDYHGSNKLVELGDTGLDDSADWPEGLQKFLKAMIW